MQVAEARKDGGRTYKKKNSCVERPKEEWIAVPVPARYYTGHVTHKRKRAVREYRA